MLQLKSLDSSLMTTQMLSLTQLPANLLVMLILLVQLKMPLMTFNSLTLLKNHSPILLTMLQLKLKPMKLALKQPHPMMLLITSLMS
jgi:hypothetical protein